ncbi:MAG TPA: hypothetical protein VFU93_14355 [Acidimicrobiales bacterium]|nr:hypothetical protein [Acidimicrobiales bacterium]
MSAKPAPGTTWLLGVVIAALLTGGITTVVTDDPPEPIVETVFRDEVVLPEHQAEVSGTIDGFVADDANGEPLTMPIELPSGRATIEGALVGGERSTIVWDGGRPFRLSGTGAIDLGPTHVEQGVGAVFWTIDGLRILSPGEYRLDTPVAVGSGGLARPRDVVEFTADEETTIDTTGAGAVGRGLPVHLEGPGTFEADGHFRVRTRAGTVDANHLEFGPGSFVVDVAADGTFSAVFNGPLSSS